MAFAIPKIQYSNYDSRGSTTLGGGTITGLDSTEDIEVGMFARMVGVPTGALVGSKTASTVTLASGVLATATGADLDVAFGYEIEFEFPPIEDSGENLETKQTTSESLSGLRQVAVNYIEGIRKLKFSYLSPTKYALVATFLENSALLGETFRYYADKTLTPYVEYELDSLKVAPKKLFPRGVDTYVWEVPLNFRRVL